MSLIIHRTCLLLLACVALSHAPFVLAEEECQVVSSVKSINNGLLRREAMREVSTDIAGKTYRGYASSEREIQVSVICPDARKIRLQVDGPARGNKAYRFSDNGVLKITAKEARMDNGAVQLAAVPRGAGHRGCSGGYAATGYVACGGERQRGGGQTAGCYALGGHLSQR
ncbi:hypothetical protein M8246_06260 [Enterobacter cloacae]|uniref:hypothetical protein n=1 Tax=Enterobacter cloacae TaxID=550 RepID=UPI00203759DA|nr:hypothetical protein [Enterobacter cloacae]MCM2487017.1 hypothetical protein [Enterobacter cloacae]